jgi:primary-amine oxidase
MVLHDVTFDGRPVFYRLSLSEMFVPYGDPRDPLHRKGAFDLGNVGAGVTANDLSRESKQTKRRQTQAQTQC